MPHVKKALAYARTLDTDGDSLINEVSAQYYDAWPFKGASAYTGTIQLAALRVGEELAKVLGDETYANYCRQWFAQAQKRFEEILWTGQYYRLYHDPASGAVSDTSLGNQLVGQWFAYGCGLGEILPKEHILSALNYVAKMNGSELGIINGVTPEGKPDVQVRSGGYANSITIGETYCFSSTCIDAGVVEKGIGFSQRLGDHIALTKRRSYNTTWNIHPQSGEFLAMDE